jgi:cytidine deaminase
VTDSRWDADLVRIATEIVEAADRGDRHTVAAAARDADGRVHRAMNLHHFTGGPCAELAAMGAAAAASRAPLVTMVAVGDRGRGVLSPCGRCRQVMLDVIPDIVVLLPGGATATARDLLPHAYLADDD